MDGKLSVCVNCNNLIENGDHFCGQCGHRISIRYRQEPKEVSAKSQIHDQELPLIPQKRLNLQRLILCLSALLTVVFVAVAMSYTGGKIDETLYGERTTSLSFNSEGDMLASGCSDGKVHLWDIQRGQKIRTLNDQFHGIISLTFETERQTLMCWHADNRISVWDTNKGNLIRVLEGPEAQCHASPAFSKRERKVAFCSKEAVRICDPLTSRVNGIFRTDDLIESLAFSWDGRILAIGSSGKVVLWDWRADSLVGSIRLGGSPSAIAFSPSGNTVAVRSYEGDIELRDIESGRVERFINWGGFFLPSLEFSPDGQFLAVTGGSGGGDWHIRIFRVSMGEAVKTLWLAPLWKRFWTRFGMD